MAKVTKTTVGDRVKLKKDNLVGVVRFVGEIQGKKGVFYGIELDEAKGKNNGSVKNTPYFKCGKKKGMFVKKESIAKTNTKNNQDAPRVTVGDTVTVNKVKCKGKIRFIGTPYSVKDSGVFYGIELVKPKGKSNGTVKDRWYFTCKSKCATFVQASGITVDGAKPPKDDKKKGGKKTGGKKKGKDTKTKDTKDTKDKTEKKEDENYEVGDRVEIKPSKKGQIKFIGSAKAWGSGTYYGIRLVDKKGGNCDGAWKDVRKFRCPKNCGIYVTLRNIVKKIDGDFDFMDEEKKYEEEAREQAARYKKEAEKLKALRERFNEWDTDGNQVIDKKEFINLAREVFDCTEPAAIELFKEVDVNGSGEISFAEFDAWSEKQGVGDKLLGDDNKEDDAAKDEEPAKEEAGDENNDDATKEDAPKEEEAANEEEPKEEEPKEDEAATEEAGDYNNNDDAAKEEDAPKEEEAPKEEDAPKEEEDAPKEEEAATEEDAGDKGDDYKEDANENEENADNDKEKENENEEAAKDDAEKGDDYAGDDADKGDDAADDNADKGDDNNDEAADDKGGDEEAAGGDEEAAGDDNADKDAE